MSTESQLREKLRKIEALFAGAGTAGERLAAEAALERVRARLGELSRQDPSIEMQFSMPDQWSRHLFLALCRRYGLKPYRYYRQRRNTVMIRAPKRFLDQVLWPEFSELDQALQAYLHQVTMRVIREGPAPLLDTGAGASDRSRLRIAMVIPPFSLGSGGHNTLFQILMRLERRGHVCSVWVQDYQRRAAGMGTVASEPNPVVTP